jgi:ABC-2 type transport system permease protein
MTAATIHRSVPFPATLASEWIKLRTLRSTWVTLIIGSVVGVGLTALIALAMGATWREWPPSELASFEPFLYSLVGTLAPGIALVVVAVKLVTNEYGTGMAHLTMTVTPRRERVLAAKLAVVTAMTVVVATVTNLLCFFTGQAIFAAAGLPTISLADPGAARTMALASLLAPVFPLLAVALAVLIRGTAGAVTAALAIIMLPSFLGPLLPPWWQRNVLGYLPGPSTDSITFGQLEGSLTYHSTGVSVVVLAGWLIVFAVLAFTSLDRRDV